MHSHSGFMKLSTTISCVKDYLIHPPPVITTCVADKLYAACSMRYHRQLNYSPQHHRGLHARTRACRVMLSCHPPLISPNNLIQWLVLLSLINTERALHPFGCESNVSSYFRISKKSPPPQYQRLLKVSPRTTQINSTLKV